MKNDPNRRRSAIVALGLLGDQKAIPILENILDDDIEILRIFAAGSLGLLGNEQGLDIALKGTKSADPSIRMHAIQAIGLIGSDSALGTLNEMLLMSPPMVERQTIELAIYQIELKMLPVEAKILNIEGKIMSISKRSAMSRWCVNELRRIGGSRAAASLQEIVERHPDPQVRRWANRKKKALDISETMKGQNADEPQ